MPRVDLIQYRRGTSTEWVAANPILASGEVGWAKDLNEIRIGDGILPWVGLTPIGGVSESAIQDAVTSYLNENPVTGVTAEYVQDAIQSHRTEPAPHTAYDADIPSLSILFQNGIT